MLSSALEIARSGLASETLRVQVAAGNIANASTPDYVQQRVEQTAIGNTGGVRAMVRPVSNANLPVAELNVDLVRETATLIQAKAAYQANLAVIVTVDQMTDSLLDIFSHNDDEQDRLGD